MSATITLNGFVTREPVLSEFSGQKVIRVPVAVHTSQKGQDGNYTTNFYSASLWGKRAEYLASAIQKGSAVFVSGELALQDYTTQAGEKRTDLRVNASTIELIGPKKGSESAPKAQAKKGTDYNPPAVSEDEDFPF